MHTQIKKPNPLLGVNEGKPTTFTTSQTAGHRRAVKPVNKKMGQSHRFAK
jgi:hypothetical protein